VTKVLVVEDERGLLRALAMNLSARGYEVVEAESGTKALTAAAAERPDVLVLDLGLPDLSGFEVIKALRQYSQIPIIVLSARTGSSEKVMALDLGADDYVTKPFNVEELFARVRAATRRSTPAEQESVSVKVGATTVDLAAKTVTGEDGERVHLTPTEWQLLEALVRQPGRLIPTRVLLTQLRGDPVHTDPSYLRIYIGQLRRKLEREPSRPRHLITEPGMGYRFQP
jgi:two-component system KDP operon response regulator KdpE